MDLFTEHFARSERSAVEHDLARGEALGRHLAGPRPIRRRRRLLTPSLAVPRRPSTPEPGNDRDDTGDDVARAASPTGASVRGAVGPGCRGLMRGWPLPTRSRAHEASPAP